jgi:acyl-CoA thioesterase-1
VIAALLALLLLAPAGAQPAPPADCPVPADMLDVPAPMPRLREAVAARRLVILAIGGSATTAAQAEPARSYPERMRAHLAAAWPGVAVELAVRRAPDAAPRHRAAQLARDIATTRPDLVLWARYATALAAGIAAARQAGADIVLVEPQFAPGWAALPTIDTYRNAMRTVAELEGVALFPRFALMESWHDAGLVDLAATGRSRQTETALHVFNCLGAALAVLVQKGAQ